MLTFRCPRSLAHSALAHCLQSRGGAQIDSAAHHENQKGVGSSTSNLLLRVRRRKRPAGGGGASDEGVGERPEELQATVVGILNQTYDFGGMADFQYQVYGPDTDAHSRSLESKVRSPGRLFVAFGGASLCLSLPATPMLPVACTGRPPGLGRRWPRRGCAKESNAVRLAESCAAGLLCHPFPA